MTHSEGHAPYAPHDLRGGVGGLSKSLERRRGSPCGNPALKVTKQRAQKGRQEYETKDRSDRAGGVPEERTNG